MRKRFFGQHLLAKGLITAPQLLAAVEYQDKYNSRLGELAVALGMVTPFDVQRINAVQAREDRLFGEAAIALGVLSEEQVHDLLATQRDGHVLLGQAIETLGYLDRPTLDAALAEYTAGSQDESAGIALPDEVAEPEVALPLFELGQKLLLRAWGLASKPGQGRIEQKRLTLSDRNARVEIDGSIQLTVMLGVPNDVTRKAASSLLGSSEPSDADQDQMVKELAKLLCENFASALAELGHKTEVSRVTLQSARGTLPPEVRVLVVPYLTHLGQVLIGLGL